MLAFAGAQDVGWLFAARTLQGIATGTAMGAISAALLDLQPANRPALGALMGAVSPLSGLALGALAAGLLVDYGPDPTRFVFWLLTGGFAVALLALFAIPETVVRDGAWRSSLRPQVAVPASMKTAFVAALPCLAASWALGGLILSLGASLTAGVLGENSHLAGGLPIFVMAGLSAIASVWLRDVAPRTTARGGLRRFDRRRRRGAGGPRPGIERALLCLAARSRVSGSAPRSPGSFVRSASGPRPTSAQALLSAVFVVSYLAFSVPAIIAGAAVTQLGLQETAEIYGAALIAIAAVALALSGNLEAPTAGAPAPAAARDARGRGRAGLTPSALRPRTTACSVERTSSSAACSSVPASDPVAQSVGLIGSLS